MNKQSLELQTPVYPVPVLIIGCYDANGRANAVAASWGGVCCSVPPCIAISVQKLRYSYKCIRDRGAFTVNIASEDQVAQADFFGLFSGRDYDKFRETGLTTERGTFVDAPLVVECPISIECRVTHTLELGSHVQFVGEVLRSWADPSVLDGNGLPDPLKVRPLVFMPKYGTYYGIGRPVGKAYSEARKYLGSSGRGV